MTQITKKTQVLEESYSFLTEMEMLQVHGGGTEIPSSAGNGCSSVGSIILH